MKRGSMRAPIPEEVRNELEKDKRMKSCAIGGDCEGTLQWHHAITFQGKRLQHAYAIVALCERHHREEAKHHDTILKVCLNLATDDELRAISKAEDYIETRKRLNTKQI